MRIISGKFKGSQLNISKSKYIRPLKDMVKESIFNLLIHSNKIFFKFEKSNILDLYSGTGSFGLECLSRKANNVCFIEKEKNAILILEKNIEKLRLNKKTEVFQDDIFHWINKQKNAESNFDLIFCDPPFKDKNIEQLIHLIFIRKLIKKNGIIILHRNKKSNDKFPDYFEILEERIYGLSKIIFGRLLS